MKFLRPLSLLLLAATLFTGTGCQKVTDLLSSHLTASVDGASFGAVIATGSIVSGNLVLVGSTTNASQVITLTVPATVAAGTYSIASTGAYTAEYKTGTANIYSGTTGQIVVTSNDTVGKTIKGTFNFSGTNITLGTVTVTSGDFYITYI